MKQRKMRLGRIFLYRKSLTILSRNYTKESIVDLTEDIRKKLLVFQRIEITEHQIYKRLAATINSPENAKILQHIADDELKHNDGLKKYTGKDAPPYWVNMWFYYLISRLFGFTFGIKLMAKREEGSP